jgi:hypothetical protein
MKPEGYHVFRSATNNLWCGMRGLDADIEKARALVAQSSPARCRSQLNLEKARHRYQIIPASLKRNDYLRNNFLDLSAGWCVVLASSIVPIQTRTSPTAQSIAPLE